MMDLYSNDFFDHLQAILLVGGGLFFLLFFQFFKHSLLFGKIIRNMAPTLKNHSVEFLSSKLGGLLWLGIVPVIIFGCFWPGSSLNWLRPVFNAQFWLWLAILLPFPILMAFFSSRKPRHRLQYPQVREKVWGVRLVVIDLLFWSLYLLGYEMFFRGVLLFGLVEVFSPWTAIIINTVIYALVHIPKGAGETFGAIPLGVLLCIITLTTGNFWIAFLVHVAMAWSNELFSLRHHTEILSPLNSILP